MTRISIQGIPSGMGNLSEGKKFQITEESVPCPCDWSPVSTRETFVAFVISIKQAAQGDIYPVEEMGKRRRKGRCPHVCSKPESEICM